MAKRKSGRSNIAALNPAARRSGQHKKLCDGGKQRKSGCTWQQRLDRERRRRERSAADVLQSGRLLALEDVRPVGTTATPIDARQPPAPTEDQQQAAAACPDSSGAGVARHRSGSAATRPGRDSGGAGSARPPPGSRLSAAQRGAGSPGRRSGCSAAFSPGRGSYSTVEPVGLALFIGPTSIPSRPAFRRRTMWCGCAFRKGWRRPKRASW